MMSARLPDRDPLRALRQVRLANYVLTGLLGSLLGGLLAGAVYLLR